MINKEEILKLQRNIDGVNTLSLLQKDFLKLVLWAHKNYGFYNFNLESVENKYVKLKDDFNVSNEIQELIDSDILTVDTKKTIFKGDYRTIKEMKITSSFLNSIND